MMKNSYWEKRELDHIKAMKQADDSYNAKLEKHYQSTLDDIQAQINDFYVRYANKDGISLAEAKKKVAAEDVQAFADTAKQMTKNKDFSAEANEKLRLYNATMRINRLEMLKSKVGLELSKLNNDTQKNLSSKLTKEYLDEVTRQAGILGDNRIDNVADDVDMVVNGSYQNATFSDRIWGNQDALKSKIDSALTSWLIRGDKPTGKLAKELSDGMNVSKSAAERLMLTESSRISTEAEKRSFEKAGIEYYWVVGKPDACEKYCKPLIIKSHTTPLKVSEIKIGENVPPIHPRCRCVMSAASDDWDEWNEWLEDKGLPTSTYWYKKTKLHQDNTKYKTFTQKASGDKIREWFNSKGTLNEWKDYVRGNYLEDTVMDYTGGLYSGLNSYLRSGVKPAGYKESELQSYIDELDGTIENFELSEPMTVYRKVGLEAFKDYHLDDPDPEKLYTDGGYMSTSVKSNSFGGADDVTLEIDVPAGVGNGAYINEFSAFKDTEYEFVLPRDSQLKIVSTTKRLGKWKVKAKLQVKPQKNAGGDTKESENN